MSVLFLEPGGDADFAVNTQTTTPPGFWDSTLTGGATIATDFVHTPHLKSIKYAPSGSNTVNSPASSCGSSGGRVSFYIYLNHLPAADNYIFTLLTNGPASMVRIQLRTTGALQLLQAGGTQISTDSSTLLTTGRWYRICLAYTWSSQTVNAWRVYIDGSLNITSGSVTLTPTAAPGLFWLGNINGDTSLDMRSSDHYTDDTTSLADTGNVWVTAKRPFANGTTNGFTTQIGSGGSGYGSGHALQENERPISTTNGWSVVAAGSGVTEEYNIEGAAVGDMNITGLVITGASMGWLVAKSLLSETASIMLNGITTNISLTSTISIITKMSTLAYPAGTGTDIGIVTATTATTISLYEAGVIVAFIGPPITQSTKGNMLQFF